MTDGFDQSMLRLRELPVTPPDFRRVRRQHARRRIARIGVVVTIALIAAGAALASRSGRHAQKVITNPTPVQPPSPSTTAVVVPSPSASTPATAGPTEPPTTFAPAPKHDGLVVASELGLNSLDPHRAVGCSPCAVVVPAMYETLIGLDPSDNRTLVPRLASSWSQNAQATVHTFVLDRRAVFADGTPVTSADVRFSWERLKGIPRSYTAWLPVDLFSSIETPDAHTVVVRTSVPDVEIFNQVTFVNLGIINSKLAQAHGVSIDGKTDHAEQWFASSSAGSGPYVLAGLWAIDSKTLVLKRNDRYWAAPAAFPTFSIRFLSGDTARRALESGDVDVVLDLPHDVASAIANPAVTVRRVPSENVAFLQLGVGMKGGEALVPKVRQAMALALDYEGLIQALVDGYGHTPKSMLPDGQVGTAALSPRHQDLAAARALMAQAGVTQLSIDAVYPRYGYVWAVKFDEALTKVKTDLALIGIDVRLHPEDNFHNSFDDHGVATQAIPMTVQVVGPDHAGPSDMLRPWSLTPGSDLVKYTLAPTNPAEVPLLDALLAPRSDADRASLYTQFIQMINDDAVVIPLVSPDWILAFRSNITGMNYSVTELLDVTRLARS